MDYEKGVGLDTQLSAVSVGFDGEFVDISVSALTVGISAMYKNGTLKAGLHCGWFGVGVSIEIEKLIKKFSRG